MYKEMFDRSFIYVLLVLFAALLTSTLCKKRRENVNEKTNENSMEFKTLEEKTTKTPSEVKEGKGIERKEGKEERGELEVKEGKGIEQREGGKEIEKYEDEVVKVEVDEIESKNEWRVKRKI